MSSKITRRRFLGAAAAGGAWIALIGTIGCERSLRARAIAAPAGGKQPWAFRSRPKLGPPAVEVTEKARDTAPGYIFVAPQAGDAGQGGSLIVDDRGQVVWFRPLPSSHGRAMNLKVQSYRGRPVLTWIETVPGEYVIFDGSYHEIARVRAGNGYSGDHHEFLISPQDTALITIYNAVLQSLSSFGGPKDGVAVQGLVQELDIETGEVIFEWRSLEHVGLDETYAKPGEDADYPGIDYFHINSIDVDHDGNLLVSARETFAVYKIDRNTGEVIWRLGGKKSDFEMGPGTRFSYQHDARRMPDGNISVFDNGTTVFHNGFPKAVEESRAIILKLDERKMPASLVREYTHGQHADAAGNVQVLPNGDVFVGWGRALYSSEFSPDGKLLFDASLPSGNRSYRAFRSLWSGHPTDRPAAVAERASEDEVRVYASWNGATEVATWEVLAGSHTDRLKPTGSAPRKGFETAIMFQTDEPYVAVKARDRSGRVLGASKTIEPGD